MSDAFECWCNEVDRLCFEIAGMEQYTIQTGRHFWQAAFDEGVTPQEALDEDMSYWSE